MRFFKTSRTLWIVVLLISYSCTKKPEANFHYSPEFNPEPGDYIYFTNESLDAIYFYWDFGNGLSSEKENPYTKYSEPGDYTVTLIAESKYRVDSIKQTILINPPTVLEIYFYSYNVAPLLMGNVKIWESVYDAMRGEDPISTINSNREGRVTFKNLEAKRYFIYMLKDTVNGEYAAGGSLGPLELNKINSYATYVQFFSDKKSSVIDNSCFESGFGIPFKEIEIESPVEYE